MIAVVLLAVLLAGLVELVVSSSENAAATAKLSRLQETGRIAIQLLASDVRRAGYYGGNAGLTAAGGTLGSAAPAGTCVANTNAWARMVGQPVFGIDDDNAGYACIEDDDYLIGDVLTLRFSGSTPVATGSLLDDRPYLRTSLFESRIFLGQDEGSADNAVLSRDARIYELATHSYYVGPSGRSCQGVGIPALFRKSVDDTGLPVSQELLAGVEHLQFRYLVDNQYLDADEVGDWSSVNAVEINVLVRAECPESGFVNNRTFAMGDLPAAYGPADGFRRQLFTNSATVRN